MLDLAGRCVCARGEKEKDHFPPETETDQRKARCMINPALRLTVTNLLVALVE